VARVVPVVHVPSNARGPLFICLVLHTNEHACTNKRVDTNHERPNNNYNREDQFGQSTHKYFFFHARSSVLVLTVLTLAPTKPLLLGPKSKD